MSLERLFSPGMLLRDSDGDGLPDGVSALVVMGEQNHAVANAGGVEIALRLGLVVSGITLPLACTDQGPRPSGRPLVIIGPSNRYLEGISVPAVLQGRGAGFVYLAPSGEVVVSGPGPRQALDAARWLAARCPDAVPAAAGAPSLDQLAQRAGGPLVGAVVAPGGVELLEVWCRGSAGLERCDQASAAQPEDDDPPPGEVPAAATPDAPAPQAADPADPTPAAPALTDLTQLFADQADLQFWIEPEMTATEMAALANLAARCGVEASAALFPVCRLPDEGSRPGAIPVRLCPTPTSLAPVSPVPAPPAPAGSAVGAGPAIAARPSAPVGAVEPARAAESPGGLVRLAGGQVQIHGNAAQRLTALAYLAGEFPFVGGWGPEHPTLVSLIPALQPARHPDQSPPASPSNPYSAPPPATSPGEIWSLEWQDEWEVHRFYHLWRQQVLPRLLPGLPAWIDLRLSEPRPVREALAAELRAGLAEQGVPAVIHVRSAYKQGYHWLEEEVLPRLQAAGPVARVNVAFRRFAGAAPPGERVIDLPIRWLQELYPIDEVIARALGITPDKTAFTMVEEGPTYRITAYDDQGDILLDESFESIAHPRRYMDAYPELGWVHPPTGFLQVEQGGRLLQERIPTDAERFWDFYQAEVLPRLRSAILEVHGPQPVPDRQPLFGDLHIAVSLSEDDRRLGIREERISPLDALHEDLYFFTLDYLAQLGREVSGTPFTAPGTVLPWVHRTEAGPAARISLSPRLPGAEAPSSAPDRPAITGLWVGEGVPVAVEQAMEQAGAQCISLLPLAEPPGPLDLGPPAPGPVPLTIVIGPDQIGSHLARLARRPGVRLWQAGTSFGGRPCYALEVRTPTPELIRPPSKITAFKPVLLINARHHANEVSSTNAALRLIELATGDDPQIQAWLRHCILVVNPLENMDGAAIHYRMMQEHPNWKLHAARFNAVGLEFYSEYANPATPYGEARVLPLLFDQYRPDVLLDDHGVPSHEWVQPFSGYNSAPYFRVSYWLPNAALYGIFRADDAAEFPAQAAAIAALREVLVHQVAAHPELTGWNRLWLERYEKYGHRWLPEQFPLELHQGMIHYTWPSRPDSFGARFPQWCVADWVTEVPDETAQGDHLQLCIEAHLTAHRATLEFLNHYLQPLRHEVRLVPGSAALCRRVGRERPFRVHPPEAHPTAER